MAKHFSFTVGKPLPKTIGACADFYKEVNELRLAMDKDVNKIKAREAEIREHIIENLSKTADTGASGRRYRAQIKTEVKPSAEDWDKIYDFIYENDRFDLLGKSLNNKAVKEMWDNKKKVPGVTKINVKTVSITKIK